MISRRKHTRDAFTLVELLVVIAILALLLAILLPSLGRARDIAQATACAATLKGIGTTFDLFKNDHRGRMPAMSDPDGSEDYSHWDAPGSAIGQAPYIWADYLVQSGVTEQNNFDCPTATGESRVGPGWPATTWVNSDNVLEYAANTNLAANSGTQHIKNHIHNYDDRRTDEPWLFSWITYPSDGLLLADGTSPGWAPPFIAPDRMGVNDHLYGPGDPVGNGLQRHNNGEAINLLYFDGHVSTQYPFRELIFDSYPFIDLIPTGVAFSAYSSDGQFGGHPTPLWAPFAPAYPPSQ